MTRDDPGSTALAGYRKATRDQLAAILRDIEGMPPRAVEAIVGAVWASVPNHPTAKKVWGQAYRALGGLVTWLTRAEGVAVDDPRIVAIGQLAAAAPQREGLGYAALVVLGVDALRVEGLPLRSSRRSRKRGALEIMADVLYWVWRKPDGRARELVRDPASLASLYWRAKKTMGRAGSVEIANATNDRRFIWLPGRGSPKKRPRV